MFLKKVFLGGFLLCGFLFQFGFTATMKLFEPKNEHEYFVFAFIAECMDRSKMMKSYGEEEVYHLKNVYDAFLKMRKGRQKAILNYTNELGCTVLHQLAMKDESIEIFFLLKLVQFFFSVFFFSRINQ